MLKYFLVIIFLLGGFFVSAPVLFAANSDIIINEIGAYEAENFEWIEIWNRGSEVVNLTGWKFWEDATNHGLTATGTTDSVVAPGEYAIICQDAEKFLSKYSVAGSIFDSAWANLNEKGEEIGLKDNAGNFIEKFTYIAAPDFSLERKDAGLTDYTVGNWQEHASGNTVGLVNSVFSTSPAVGEAVPVIGSPPVSSSFQEGAWGVAVEFAWSQIRINEIVPNPAIGNEWVELYNPTNYDLDLAGGAVCDSRNTVSTCKALTGKIFGGGWFKVDLKSVTYLNNDGDTMVLKNPAGAIIDQKIYGEENKNLPSEGEALAKKIDGGAEWALTEILTPGARNIISMPVVPATTVATSTSQIPAFAGMTGGVKAKSAVKDVVKVVWRVKAPSQGAPGEKILFTAAESADPRGGILFYNWNFGDRVNLDGANVEHVYATSGIFSVSISATSSAGTVGVKNFQIHIAHGLTINNAGAVISEIVPNPEGNDNEEFIELRNTATSTLDLSGWFLKYGDKDYELPERTKIAPLGFLVFERAVTKFALDNAGGRVDLLTPDKNMADSVKYDKAVSGKSFNIFGKEGIWMGDATPGMLADALSENSPPQGGLANLSFPRKRESAVAKSAKSQIPASAGMTTAVGMTVKTWLAGGVELSDARELAKGAIVKVKGVVSVLPGVFGVQYFYISGSESGIQIYQYKKDFPELRVGDLVEVSGEISEASGVKRIKIKNKKDIDILATEQAVSSTILAQEDLGAESAGGLVKIAGEITEIKSNYMYVDNGAAEATVYFKKGAKIDKTKFKEGELVEIMGILELAKNGVQIWPRGQNDIVVTGESEDLIKKNALLTINNVADTASKYLTATAGGITTLLLAFFARARGAVVFGALKKVGALAISLIKRNKA